MHRLLAIGITITLLGCGSTDAPAQSTEPEVPVAEAAEPAAPLDGEEDTIDEEHVDEDTIDDEDIDEGQDDEAAATAPDLGAHEVVIVVVHDDPLLRSEERLLDVIAERMQMRRIDAIRRDATDEEASFARSRFAGEGRESAEEPEHRGSGGRAREQVERWFGYSLRRAPASVWAVHKPRVVGYPLPDPDNARGGGRGRRAQAAC
jgi:hypothetical protein